MPGDDSEADILRVPSPPQRRLSRSSIDLRDLEQQQLQPHDRVTHTDSAPSMMALENFYLKDGHKNKSEIVSKANFLNKPLDCFHTQLNNKPTNAIDTLTIESDNEDLARFIEDNYQYFKKQNGGTDLTTSTSPANASIPNKQCEQTNRNLQLQACSDPDFLTLKNNIDCCDSCIGVNAINACEKKIKSKKHKMSALSDSDFIVSFGNKSKRFTLKSKIPFKTILNGKFPKVNKYNSLEQPTASATTATVLSLTTSTTPMPTPTLTATANVITTASPMIATGSTLITANLQPDLTQTNKKYTYKGLNNHLSQSLNGCYLSGKKYDQANQSKSIQRVLSEGNETAHIHHTTSTTSNDQSHSQSNYNQRPPRQRFHQSHDAFDMFLKLFQCEKNNSKNMYDRQSTSNKFNYKIVVNSKEFDYCDSILGNYAANAISNVSQNAIMTGDNVDKIMGGKDDGLKSIDAVATSSITDQKIIVNHPYDENVLFNLNADVGLHTSHVLVNNLVITSPPVTPKQLLSPKTINKEQTTPATHSPIQNYFSYSQNHLSPHMLNASDTTSMSMEMIANNNSPLEQLVSIRTDSDVIMVHDLKVPEIGSGNLRSSSSTTLNNGNAAAEQNFIKNDLALINSKTKCDKNNSCTTGNMDSSRIRKPSVTYDINVINKSQDFNIDDICPQRSSYAARSGSTTSTSKWTTTNIDCFQICVACSLFLCDFFFH